MTGAGRHIRSIPPASSIIDQFPYPALTVERSFFVAGLAAHNEGKCRSNNPCVKGTIERHEWRAGWDYGDRLEETGNK